LTGDSEANERQWWLKYHPELVHDCAILKLPHHGSRNGTDARWLQAVRPDLAVASVGKLNEYGHPHAETISLLRRAGIPFLRTDQHGTITISTDGRGWQVVEPSLASHGHPTQAEIDRLASGVADGSSRRSSRVPTR
jgi:competence protein ComEC